jgi:hypothetical protein
MLLHEYFQELLYNKHVHLDGSKLKQAGFQYNIPELKIEHLKEVCFYGNWMFPVLVLLTK